VFVPYWVIPATFSRPVCTISPSFPSPICSTVASLLYAIAMLMANIIAKRKTNFFIINVLKIIELKNNKHFFNKLTPFDAVLSVPVLFPPQYGENRRNLVPPSAPALRMRQFIVRGLCCVLILVFS